MRRAAIGVAVAPAVGRVAPLLQDVAGASLTARRVGVTDVFGPHAAADEFVARQATAAVRVLATATAEPELGEPDAVGGGRPAVVVVLALYALAGRGADAADAVVVLDADLAAPGGRVAAGPLGGTAEVVDALDAPVVLAVASLTAGAVAGLETDVARVVGAAAAIGAVGVLQAGDAAVLVRPATTAWAVRVVGAGDAADVGFAPPTFGAVGVVDARHATAFVG